MITFTLDTPITVGSLSSQVTVSTLQLTAVTYSSTPALAPLGTATLDLTLTDPVSGFQEVINYQDSSVLTLWGSFGDQIAEAVFAKLVADGRLAPGTAAPVVSPAPVTPPDAATPDPSTSAPTA
jgi:hypothetical protein